MTMTTMPVRWRLTRFCLAALVLSATPAVHAVNGKPAVDRDTVVFAMAGDIGNLDAGVASTGDSHRYAIALNDKLYGFGAPGNLEPRAASGVNLSDDAQRCTFTLRRDGHFRNGVTLTAKEVKFSPERILKPETKSTRRPNFAPVGSDYETLEIQKVFAETEGRANRKSRDQAFRRVARILHDDGQTVPITELFIVFAKDSPLAWQQQTGSGYYNLREIG